MTNKKQRGQFFTTSDKVQKVLTNLLQNEGNLLEPSAGAGHLVLAAKNTNKFNITAWEIDTNVKNVSNTPFIYGNFFTLADNTNTLFDSILSNPPFVAWKKVEADTIDAARNVKKNYTDKTNLYHLFIDRCIDLTREDGEMVFIVPKEWLYTTSANPLREKISREGIITHFVDCGEEKLFIDADVPAIVIFRWQKTLKPQPVKYAESLTSAFNNEWSEKTLINHNNRLMLLPEKLAKQVKTWGSLKECFNIKVGMVTAADNVFRVPNNMKLEPDTVKTYITTKGVERFIDVNHIKTYADLPNASKQHLEVFKTRLLARGIRKFTENNWWHYGAVRNREAMVDKTVERFYCLAKTRNPNPFFNVPVNEATFFSGGILGLYSTGVTGGVKVSTVIKILNHKNFRPVFEAMFLTTGNKVSFQPATLSDVPFPKTEVEAQKWLQSNS